MLLKHLPGSFKLSVQLLRVRRVKAVLVTTGISERSLLTLPELLAHKTRVLKRAASGLLTVGLIPTLTEGALACRIVLLSLVYVTKDVVGD